MLSTRQSARPLLKDMSSAWNGSQLRFECDKEGHESYLCREKKTVKLLVQSRPRPWRSAVHGRHG